MDPRKGIPPIRALILYLVASPAVIWTVNAVTERLGLPEWFVPLAIAILILGLPVVVTTAVVQARGKVHFADGPGAVDPDPTPSEAERLARSRAPRGRESWSGVKNMFTWRNTVSGGFFAAAIWFLMALGWLMLWASE